MRFRERPPLKTAEDLECLRRSNRFARRVLSTLGEKIAPGVTTRQLDELAERMTAEAGAAGAFKGYRVGDRIFPATICASVNEAVVHGVPNDRPLVPGDIVSIDYGCVLGGWYGDTAWTWAVGEPSAAAAHLMKVTREALNAGIRFAQPGKRVFDIARAIQQHCETNGCSVVRTLVGHGIGRKLHEPPQVPNYAHPASLKDRLRPGMVICIEPMVTAGAHEVEELEDTWTAVTKDRSLAAHYEHCVAIGQNGPEILSLPDEI